LLRVVRPTAGRTGAASQRDHPDETTHPT
jgi:hypothetical protein